jgi:hypothetical protein
MQISQYLEGYYGVFRTCYVQTYGSNTICSRDTDCPANTPCDLQSHLCAPPSFQQEEDYFTCVFNSVGSEILVTLKQYLGVPSATTNEELYSTLRQQTLTKDCMSATGLNFPFHTYITFEWDILECDVAAHTNFGYILYDFWGVDYSLDPGPTSLEPYCGQRLWVCIALIPKFVFLTDLSSCTKFDFQSDVETCLSVMNTNYGGCALDTNSTGCKNTYQSAPQSFCGVCLNEDTCISVSSLDDCSGFTCVLPDGSVDSTLDQARLSIIDYFHWQIVITKCLLFQVSCEQSGICSVSCGYSCQSAVPGMCVVQTSDPSVCNSTISTFYQDLNLCAYETLTQGNCSAVPNATFVVSKKRKKERVKTTDHGFNLFVVDLSFFSSAMQSLPELG